jgi:hypothetical protein
VFFRPGAKLKAAANTPEKPPEEGEP